MNKPVNLDEVSELDVAIIGMSGRFPGAKNVDEFWQNLKNGVESISFLSDEEIETYNIDPEILKDPDYVKAAATLDDVELFDASFFGYTPREAEMMDPQSRVFLECAWEAFENAGYDPKAYPGSVGVFATQFMSTYLVKNVSSPFDTNKFTQSADFFHTMVGHWGDFLPTRVSYKLNLRGPSVNVQGACSSSLIALHLARQSLLAGECDMALAGGVTIYLPQKEGYMYEQGMVLSPDGHCRAFDANSQGTIFGNGVGMVILKPLREALADRNSIYAVIKGSAFNNDGGSKIGYAAPSAKGQADVITEALANAGVGAETISYVEAHGTGTHLGDPVEISGLTQAFSLHTEKKGFCAIGSVKTNVGHLGHAAGITSLIKATLALKHKLLPPSLHFVEPNPKINFADSPFYVNDKLSEWKAGEIPRRSGVSSFGFGGTNVHVILEEAPPAEPSESSRPCQLLMLVGKTDYALDTATTNLVEHLKQHPDLNLADVAYTYQVSRRHFKYRRMLVCNDLDDAVSALETLDPKRVVTKYLPNLHENEQQPVVFMFSGQGAQYVNMALDLYNVEPTFHEQVARCSELLIPHLGLDLRHVLYPTEEQAEQATQQLQQTAIAQPALFVIEYALAKLWMSWGVHPQAMIGHSIGEYVAACLADVLSLEDALALVAARGQLMQQLPNGTMLAVPLSEKELQPLLGQKLSLALINGPSLCVVSGPTDAVDTLENELKEQGVDCKRLHTSHAFHSDMMEPILEPFTSLVKQFNLNPPQIPYISNVTGTWMTATEATDPSYWARHLRSTVRFASGLQQLFEHPDWILLEVGPGRMLNTLAKQHPNKAAEQVVLSSLRHPHDQQSDVAFLFNTVGKLWLSGVWMDWDGFYAHEQRYRIALPTYPFERQRYWIEARNTVQNGFSRPEPVVKKKNPTVRRQSSPNIYAAPRNELEQNILNVWQDLLGIGQLSIHDNFFALGGESMMALRLIEKLRQTLKVELSPDTLLEAPTPAAIAELISQNCTDYPLLKTRQVLPSSLVALRSEGFKKPLFCVHPVGGNVLCYADLVRHLDPEQPVYGFHARGVDGKQDPLTTIEDMASDYIKAMQTIQAEGPYLLSGWSFGGLIAFEMSQQLQQQGHKVDFLGLIDVHMPPADSDVSALDNAALLTWFAVDLQFISSAKDVTELVTVLRQMDDNEHLPYILDLAKRLNRLPETLELDTIKPLLEVFTANFLAIFSYVPQVYSNQMTLFQSSELLFIFESQELCSGMVTTPEETLRIWEELSLQPLKVYNVPGNHLTILSEPHVQVFGQLLKDCLDGVAKVAVHC